MKVDRPSARRALETSSAPTRFSTISPVAKTSPVVSTAVISMTTIIEMIAAAENLGMPKKNGVVTSNQGDVPTLSNDASPRKKATPVPITRPASTDGGHEALEDPLDDHDDGQRAHGVGQVLAAGGVRVRAAA